MLNLNLNEKLVPALQSSVVLPLVLGRPLVPVDALKIGGIMALKSVIMPKKEHEKLKAKARKMNGKDYPRYAQERDAKELGMSWRSYKAKIEKEQKGLAQSLR